ncbi:hypothetical protein TrispH2_011573 [Trichoplax sp. H2]|nr:hypothetical protein TrispH2_011573 [Trichoplax sp. H2]|eukprot:RDD36514.1 hypothetical protein TrispH2_011573 [Trichoplax sp. H2]
MFNPLTFIHFVARTFEISLYNGETVRVNNPDSPAQRYFNLIIKDIGAEWKDLARVLDFDQTRIKTIKANNSLDVNDQCAEMLHVQHNTKGKSFNKLELIKALYKANLAAVAEKINIDPDEITQDPGNSGSKINRQQSTDTTEYLFDVADKLQEDWIKLVPKLDREGKIDIKKIQNKSNDHFDRGFEFLDKWHGIYGKSATKNKLKAALKVIKRADVADEIDNTITGGQSTMAVSSAPNTATTIDSSIKPAITTAEQGGRATDPIKDEGRRREIFMYIADRIKSKKLKEFGRKLKLDPNDVDDITGTSDVRFDKCIHLLETWYTTFASEATFDVLLSVLKSCKETLIADELKKN